MPYLKFLANDGTWLQLSGNKADDFVRIIASNDKLVHKELATAWVKALFTRRDAKIVLQKIERGELPASGRDKAEEDLDDAEDEEEEAEEAYQKACASGTGAAAATAAAADDEKKDESKSSAGNPYGAVVKRNVVSEDMF